MHVYFLKGSALSAQCLSWYWIGTRNIIIVFCTNLDFTQSQNPKYMPVSRLQHTAQFRLYERKDHIQCATQARVNLGLYASTVTAVVKTVYTKSTQTAVHSHTLQNSCNGKFCPLLTLDTCSLHPLGLCIAPCS